MENTVKVLDGGFSSQLSQNVNFDAEYANHPLWCARFLLTDSDAVVQTHRDYIRAGADIITTNTYQASIDGFQSYFDLSHQESYNLIKDAVQMTRNAIYLEHTVRPLQRKVLIAGSVGSYGACLHDGSEYNGNYLTQVTSEVLRNWHRPRISALVESEVDFLAIETLPGLSEAQIILDLLKEEFPHQKAWISFTCKDAEHTAANDHISRVAEKLWPAYANQLIAVGVNCSHPSFVKSLLNLLKAGSQRNGNSSKLSQIPTIAYPNSDEIYDKIQKRWIKSAQSSPVHTYVPEWLNIGLSIIGGCCRTTAKDTQDFRNCVDNFNKRLTYVGRN